MIVEAYIRAKRAKLMAELIVTLSMRSMILNSLVTRFANKRREYYVHLKKVMIVKKKKKIWAMHKKKIGPELTDLIRKRLRSAVTF